MNKNKKINIILAIFIIIFAILVIFIKSNIIFSKVVTESMTPTINEGDRVIAISKNITSINTGDIIIFKNYDKNLSATHLVKRVVAKGNDFIEIKSNKLFLNNEFRKDIGIINAKPLSLKLEENQYFLLGDNVNNSYDSRNYGPILKS